MAPQNSTLINDSTGSATVPVATSAEELSNFSPILPPRNHSHRHHHHHHHRHHHHKGEQMEQDTTKTSNEGAKDSTANAKSGSLTGADGGKPTNHAKGLQGPTRATTSRSGSFRMADPTDDPLTSLQSMPYQRSGYGNALDTDGKCGTGRGTVKRELLSSIPCHQHTHHAPSKYPESIESDDALESSPEPPVETVATAQNEPSTSTVPGTTSSDVEIPIWIRGEARFVSGINEATTCCNIIRALIDDEVQNGNYGPEDVAVSRDVNDYVIIERWREVEQVLTGDTRILSIWNAWGNAKSEVQFRLRINKTNMEKGAVGDKENKSKKQKEKIGLINRMMRKVLKQGEAIQNHLSQISQKSTEKRQQDKFRKYVRKNCGKHLIMENFLHDAATNLSDDLSVDGEPLVTENGATVVSSGRDKDRGRSSEGKEKVRRSTFPGKLLFSARKDNSAGNGSGGSSSTAAKEASAGRVLRNLLFESSDQLVDGLKANEDELLLVIDHTSDSDSGIFTNNALSRRDTLPKRPNFGSMVEIDRYTKETEEELVEFQDRGCSDTVRRQQKYHRSKRRYDSLRCHHQNRRRLESAASEDDGVASSAGGHGRTSDLEQELVELVADESLADGPPETVSDGDDDADADDDLTPPVDDFESGEQLDLHRGTFNRTSFRFDLIRQEIEIKTSEMQHLLEQEEALLRRLKLKSAKFHAENQIYRSHIALDFHVERLQNSIDRCAQEIIDIEQQLLETKMEIEEKSPLIDNLRALLEAQEAGQCYRRPIVAKAQDQRYGITTHFPSGGSVDGTGQSADTCFTQVPAATTTRDATSSRTSLTLSSKRKSVPGAEVEFVDNIYEFCDNNQSFVV
ncbi:uncharacterized protein LOC125955159 [Anopheles darlingi]|uniref:uncharacterized protein LOC125955159 n=1 Tax=Anopheles darlingi TaxID=43151 RepID=UPI00210027A3|nr:uncharacterized protein LOC125955159 [Anopheles darlingi]XP_049542086.1 uncharacterized protein LOC125955159 [Anopheles darlingi]